MLDLNTIHHGCCLDVLKTMPDNCIDAIVCDPPYGLGKEPDALAMLTDWMQGRDYVPKGKKGFMGAEWDAFVPQPAIWRECLRVLKPGGHLVAFAGTRTQHLMALGLQIAGFELRDMLAWIYGSGFPKSLNISKAIDRESGAVREVTGSKAQAQGAESMMRRAKKVQYNCRPGGAEFGQLAQPEYDITAPATDAAKQWDGWGTALKPALETITLARKPLCGTVAANVLLHGTGGLNIDGCRIETGDNLNGGTYSTGEINPGTGRSLGTTIANSCGREYVQPTGRWPANLLLDGSPEVLAGFPNTGKSTGGGAKNGDKFGGGYAPVGEPLGFGDQGSAARFFYSPKASKRDRDEGLEGFEAKLAGCLNMRNDAHAQANGMTFAPKKNTHSTVKPTAVMQWLCRLITPPGGIILDPFTGSGSTLKAAVLEGFQFIGIEREAEYVAIARARVAAAQRATPPLTLF